LPESFLFHLARCQGYGKPMTDIDKFISIGFQDSMKQAMPDISMTTVTST